MFSLNLTKIVYNINTSMLIIKGFRFRVRHGLIKESRVCYNYPPFV